MFHFLCIYCRTVKIQKKNRICLEYVIFPVDTYYSRNYNFYDMRSEGDRILGSVGICQNNVDHERVDHGDC